jgi:curved DNA-binding protein CbpA
MNAFGILGLPEKLTLSAREIDTAWRETGARIHPDAGGGEAAFAELRAARDTLASPANRLAHWLGLHGHSAAPRGTIAPEIMDLFGPVAEATRQAEEFARRRAAATTALGLAVLEAGTLRIRESVESTIASLDDAIAITCADFEGWQQAPESVDAAKASAVVRGLRFLEKWKRNLMSAYSGLA